MTDLMTPPPEEEKTYTSDQQGLREAATEIGSNEPEISEVKHSFKTVAVRRNKADPSGGVAPRLQR